MRVVVHCTLLLFYTGYSGEISLSTQCSEIEHAESRSNHLPWPFSSDFASHSEAIEKEVSLLTV